MNTLEPDTPPRDDDFDPETGPDPDAPFDECIVIPIEDSIDLHLFRPNEVKAVVLEYLDQAAEKGFAEVRIIHGRGIGERRRQVRALLETHPVVLEFRDAPGGPRGGWGATVVRLRQHGETR